MQKNFPENLEIYRVKNDCTGTAAQFQFSAEKKCIFLEMARQTKEKDKNGFATFDWANKIVFKLGAIDIGEILCVLNGKKFGTGQHQGDNVYKGLFHSNNDGNSILKFERGKTSGYYLDLSVKKNDSNPIRMSLNIGDSESEIMRLVFEDAIKSIYCWK